MNPSEAIVIQLIAWADGRPLNCAGEFICTLDIQAAPLTERWLTTTEDPSEALQFPNMSAALEKYREVLLSQPVRWDGRPNRPLTALNVGFIPLTELKPRDPRDPDYTRKGIFRDHNCWMCKDGTLPCSQGSPYQCEYPHARND